MRSPLYHGRCAGNPKLEIRYPKKEVAYLASRVLCPLRGKSNG